MKARLWWLLPAVGIGAGVVALCAGSANLCQSIRSKSWPRTDGIISAARIDQETSRRYHAKIAYDYEVGGVPYTGTRIAFGLNVLPKEVAQDVVERYRPGKRVWIFYSPTHPQDALLEPGVSGGTRRQLGLGFFFLTISAAILMAGRKKPNPQGGANGKQPLRSEGERAYEGAASYRSP